ncbi:MAG: GAF domain-containing protein [Polyangia bacterium]
MQEIPVPAAGDVTDDLDRLADLHTELVQTETDRELLARLAGYLARWRPLAINLIQFTLGESGEPVEGHVSAVWSRGEVRQVEPGYRRFKVGHYGISKLWLHAPHQPVLLSDIASDPRADSNLREGAAALGYRAVMVMPLYSENNGGWQGMVSVNWAEPRTFSHAEFAVCRLLMASLATHIGGQRSKDALRTTLAETELLHEVSKRLNGATSLDETLRALAQPAPFADELDAILCSFERGDKDKDTGGAMWLTVMHGWHEGREYQNSPVGTRINLGDLPFARLYLDSPGEPILIGDVETDPRLDEVSRAMYRHQGVRATLLLALMLQGRWVGLLNLSWQRPMELGERERRIYRSLAKQAALLVDNRLMLDRLQASLEQTEQKSATLRALLDHMPVGVMLFTPKDLHVLANRAAIRLLKLGDSSVGSGLREADLSQHHVFLPDSERPLPPEELPSTRAFQTGEMQSLEMDVVLPGSDSRTHLDVIAAPVRDETGAISSVVAMMSDIGERKRTERERARLSEEVIRVQAAALAERSSPLIPISDDILVLPLIGSLDTERGHQVMDTLLGGTSQSRARVAIIDITGVRTVDTQAASALTNAAQALRLLGVEPVLTGIRPEVAQTLIGLGVRLDGITTRSTLQSGIQYALRRLGQKTLG